MFFNGILNRMWKLVMAVVITTSIFLGNIAPPAMAQDYRTAAYHRTVPILSI